MTQVVKIDGDYIVDLIDGQYLGSWSGYSVRFIMADYEPMLTVTGVRGRIQCILHVKDKKVTHLVV